MLKVIQRFDKYCRCHLQVKCVMDGSFFGAYRAGSRWSVGFDGADWWNGTA
jgi:hypothetical protein